jgi:dTDP-4-amino-4,6-dideoxygalactose transaminase
MARIVSEHQYVPVPVDVSVVTLSPDVEQIKIRTTKRTRAILVAHLFGSRIKLDAISEIARANNLQLWEDVAQGFDGVELHPDNLADISFYSFGMIKTRTALGGA